MNWAWWLIAISKILYIQLSKIKVWKKVLEKVWRLKKKVINPCLCHWCYTLDVLWMFHLSVSIWRNHRVDDLCRHAIPGGSLIQSDKSSKNHIQRICFLAADYIDKSHHSVCLQNVHSILEQYLRQVSGVKCKIFSPRNYNLTINNTKYFPSDIDGASESNFIKKSFQIFSHFVQKYPNRAKWFLIAADFLKIVLKFFIWPAFIQTWWFDIATEI